MAKSIYVIKDVDHPEKGILSSIEVDSNNAEEVRKAEEKISASETSYKSKGVNVVTTKTQVITGSL